MALSCEFCGKNRNKIVKCVQCHVIMCKKCKCIHSKIHGSNGHASEIIRIRPRNSRLSAYLFFGCCKRVPERYRRAQSEPMTNKESDSRYRSKLKATTFDDISDSNYANDTSHLIEFSNLNIPENGQSKLRTDNNHLGICDKFEVLKCFETDVSVVSRVLWCSKKIIWITRASDEMLQMLKVEKGNLATVAMFDIKAHDIAITPTGNLLIASSDSVLKVVDKDRKEIHDSKYVISPFLPTSIHFSRHGKVVAGVMERGSAFPVSGERKLIVMDINGDHEEYIGYDSQHQSLFSYIYSICSDDQNYLYVLDRINKECHGRIIILNNDRHVSSIYIGHHIFNIDKNFRPKDVAITNAGNIIITETQKHMLHIINRQGALLQYINTREVVGITYPQSLDLSYRNHLIIGTSRKKGSNEKSKIYFVSVTNNVVY